MGITAIKTGMFHGFSPEVLDYRRRGERLENAAFRFMRARRPDYAVLFPNWYPDIVSREELAEPVHRVVLSENFICGGKEMVVYRMHWDALEESDARLKSALPPPERDDGQEETAR